MDFSSELQFSAFMHVTRSLNSCKKYIIWKILSDPMTPHSNPEWQVITPTTLEKLASMHYWVIICTRCDLPTWPLTLTFDLLTWLSIGIPLQKFLMHL